MCFGKWERRRLDDEEATMDGEAYPFHLVSRWDLLLVASFVWWLARLLSVHLTKFCGTEVAIDYCRCRPSDLID